MENTLNNLIEKYIKSYSKPISVNRFENQFKLIEQISKYDTETAMELSLELKKDLDRAVDYTLGLFDLDDPNDEKRFLNMWYSQSPETRESAAEYFTEIKLTKPKLFHPVMDQVIG